jgi:hypothetical protein
MSDEANGVTLDDVLLLVTDRTHRFCDFELRLDPARQAAALVELGDLSITQDEVETEVSETERVLWRYASELHVLQVVTSNGPVQRWVMLNGGHVILGLGLNETLRILHCRSVVPDPTGNLQGKWLQEVAREMATP